MILNFNRTVPWWDLDSEGGVDAKLATAVVDTAMDIEKRQASIHEGNKRHARLYAGYLPSGLATGSSATSGLRAPFEATKALVRSVCDTSHAMIVRSRPKSTFVTDGADWKVQRAAEDLDQFMVGAYTVGGLYQVAPRSFHDSTIFGTGGWKYVPRGRGQDFKVCYERFLIDDILVDEDECREHVDPSNVFHRTIVQIDPLIRKYASGDTAADADRRNKLMASVQTSSWPGLYVPKGRTVLVEAYHVDADNPSENRRVLAVPGLVLETEKWPHPFVPFTWLWWCLPITGFYGDGIAYRQYGRQQRVTYMHKWIQRCLDLFATPTAWVDPSGGPPTMQLSNELGKIISARKPPSFQTQQIVPPEVYRWLDKLEADGYEDEGISQVSAAGQLPPGLESAPAQREYVFKEGQRFAPVSQRWEHAVAVDTANKTVAFYRHHVKSGGSTPKVRWADRRLMYDIEWPDLDADAYMIRAEASSLDSLSPSSRTQSALELAQTGWVTPEEGRALVGHPDLRESDELGNSGTSYAKWVLRKLWRGEAIMVDEKSDMTTLLRVVKQGRLLAIIRNAPRTVVDEMDRFIESIDRIQKEAADAAAAEQAQQMAAAAPPPGMSQESAQGRPAPFAGKSGYT